jgi:hypothetical protein
MSRSSLFSNKNTAQHLGLASSFQGGSIGKHKKELERKILLSEHLLLQSRRRVVEKPLLMRV